MKTDRNALIWGTIIGTVLMAAVCILAFDFPKVHLPHAREWIGFLLASGFFFWGIIRAYQALWKRLTFWLLVATFLPIHFSLWWFFVLKLTQDASLLQTSASYAVAIGAEVFVFAVTVLRLCHRGPDTSSFK